MFAKKDVPASIPVPEYFTELEYLYARRSAIDSLIESLEAYDRYQLTAGDQGELATA